MGFVEEGDETREAGPNFWMGFYLPECSSSSGVCVGGGGGIIDPGRRLEVHMYPVS